MKNSITQRIAILATAVVTSVLTGCGAGVAGPGGSTIIPPTGSAHLTGKVMGGQQPISGATIQLYAANATTLRGAAQPLVSAVVTTDAGGNFNIAGQFTCPASNPLVYLSAVQGNPGLGGGSNNTAIALLAALGPCNSLVTIPFVDMNEVTTAATVYALAGFMTDSQHIGAPPALATGLANAFQTAPVLVNIGNGSAPGPGLGSNASMPVTKLYTVANILAACINTNGSISTGTACGTLFSNTAVSGSSPQDTVTAALNMVAYPAKNTAALFALVSSTPPFEPTLSVAPADWTMALNYTGGGLKTPYGIAIDANGDAWVANESGNSITKLGPGGSLLSGSGGFTASGVILGPQALAIDTAGKVWVANTLDNSVVVLNADGTESSRNTTGGIDGPASIALDSAGSVWVANFTGNSVTVLNNSGSLIDSSPLIAGGVLNLPATVAVDATGNAWIANTGTSTLLKLKNTGVAISTGNGYTDGNIQEPLGIGFDSAGNAWVAENGLNTVNSLTQGGLAAIGAPVGGMSSPVGVAIDGANNVWTTNSVAAGSVAVIPAGSSTANLYGALSKPMGLAVDASGNLWTANAADNSVSEFVGVATPVTTPAITRNGP